MTSKNSFLVNSKENHKRRTWVWIVSILAQLLIYPSVLTLYLGRIKIWNEEGAYPTEALFKKVMYDATMEAIGFQSKYVIHILILGVIIAVQGFSYLYDKKKVDMYKSVPVSEKRRFTIIYINGILIYLIPAVIATLLSLLIAGVQGAVNGTVLAECALAFLVNLLYFLIVYHTSMLAVMLTGNLVVTGFAVMTFLFSGYVAVMLYNSLKWLFFDTVGGLFTEETPHKLSIAMEYLAKVNRLARIKSVSSKEMMEAILPLYAKWFVVAVLLLALSYWCYRKRPAEATGQAIAFPVIKPFVKVFISAIVGLSVFYVVEDVSYHNTAFAIFTMVVGCVLCCGVMEAIYDFDIRSVIRHLASTGTCVVTVIVIFCIFQFDVLGYDTYIPAIDDIESIAVDIGPYQQYWEWDSADESITYVSDTSYLKENMFLTDIEAVCELVKKGQGLGGVYENDERFISVLYRLKSGREVSKRFIVDWNDESNEELLNRIVGTKEYRDGFYRFMKDDIPYDTLRKQIRITYTNGPIECELPSASAKRLRDAWAKDMEQFDFTMAKYNRVCGVINWKIGNSYSETEMPIYESFTNTIALLEEYEAYYPMQLRAEDIEGIEITNYRVDEQEEAEIMSGFSGAEAVDVVDTQIKPVTAYFEEPQEIEEIIAAVFPQEIGYYWNGRDMLDRNFDILITFKTDTEYPYGRGFYSYKFFKGQAPGFVVERTAQ